MTKLSRSTQRRSALGIETMLALSTMDRVQESAAVFAKRRRGAPVRYDV
jgi:hypothetical protein